jgi:hypothetical protein
MHAHKILSLQESGIFAPVDVIGGGCGQACQIFQELLLAPSPIYQGVELGEGKLPQFGTGNA